MPVMWNIGTTVSDTVSAPDQPHCPLAALAISVRCVCMQPLGSPVVPEVYGSSARSSADTAGGVNGSAAPCASASAQRVSGRPSGSGASASSQSRIAAGTPSAGSMPSGSASA